MYLRRIIHQLDTLALCCKNLILSQYLELRLQLKHFMRLANHAYIRKGNVVAILQTLTQILDFAVVGRLARDSSNIIDLIRDTYNVI